MRVIAKLTIVILPLVLSCSTQHKESNLEDLKLKNFRPKSVYNIQKTLIENASFPIIDMHSHDYASSKQEIEQWVRTMKKMGIEKTVILSYQTGNGFDSIVNKYSQYPQEFEIWCGIDYTGYDTDPKWAENACLELERCYNAGARGVGELGDKGEGLFYSKPTKAYGMHCDNPGMDIVWAKCAELGMPVNIHIAEPIWMYEPMDSTNDGLMNSHQWRIDLTKEGILDHAELIQTLENAVKRNPNTTFIACHFANCSYDLNILANLLDKYPNLYADNSARYAETAPIPRHVKAFYEKYQDRIIYGTDMGMNEEMYKITFRILESDDEHFYETEQFGYHWALNGFDLSDSTLEKVYKSNALKVLNTN